MRRVMVSTVLPPSEEQPRSLRWPHLAARRAQLHLTPSDRRRFGAYGGDHIGIDVEAACCRSDYDDLGTDWSGDMAFIAS